LESSYKNQGQKKITEVKTFSVPFDLGEIKEKITITTNTPSNPSNPSKEQIINQAFKFHTQGNISEAAKLYQYFIDQGFKDHRVFSNYGIILNDLGKLKKAELYTLKAIELKHDYANAHYNLGIIFKGLGKLQDAELSYRKAIEIKPDYAEAHLNLGIIFSDLGNLQNAESSTRKAIELNPNFAEAHLHLGSILRALGKNKEAILCAEKTLEIRSWSIQGLYGLTYTCEMESSS